MNLRPARQSGAARVLALVLLVVGWGVPLAFPHLAEDDLLCLPADAAEGPEATHVAASSHAGAPDHCAVCHLQRSFRGADLDGRSLRVALESARILPPAPQPAPLRLSRHRIPARAPPA